MMMILRFNRLVYLKAGLLSTVGMLLASQFEGLVRLAILLAVASTMFWIVSSLAASWWIYDREHIFALGWLDGALERPAGKWLNLHAGLDEIDGVLQARSAGETLDIFDPHEVTEPSLQHARRVLGLGLGRQTNWRYLPAANQSYDTVFLVLAAHEFRRAAARERLFIEIQRVLRDSGRVVVVEHLRDPFNFAVFGPGAFHFLTRRSWVESTRPAGLVVLEDRKITPFVHALVLGKQCAL